MKKVIIILFLGLVLTGCTLVPQVEQPVNQVKTNEVEPDSGMYLCQTDDDCVADLECDCAWRCINKDVEPVRYCPDQAERCQVELIDAVGCICQNNRCQIEY